MAGLTKEQRQERERQKQIDLENRIRAELEEKLRNEFNEKLKNTKMNKSDDVLSTSTKMHASTKIPLDTIVPVTSNVHGKLIYISKKLNGYLLEWDDYGSVEYMELSELVSLRNSDRRFFEDNWIVLGDTENYSAFHFYDFLKVTKYYKNVFTPDTIDGLFEKSPEDIIKYVSPLSNGMKDTIAARAKLKIDSKMIDSKSVIKALEKSLNVQLDF